MLRPSLVCRLSPTSRHLVRASTTRASPSSLSRSPASPPLFTAFTSLSARPPTRTMSSTTAAEPPRPTGLIANKGIELLTFSTPNGYKISILLEELKEAYGLEYTWQSINIMQNIQKEPWFTKYCPNGRIPVIIDHDRNDFAVFEGLAILTYLTRHYDPEHKFSFDNNSDDFSVVEQWMAFQHGGVGPMQGQANHFFRLAKERIPYPTQRYVGETERLYGVLDARLAEREYLAGPGKGTYSIADIANWSWVNIAYFSGVELKKFEHLFKWWEKISQRPAVQKGVQVPKATPFGNAGFLSSEGKDPEQLAKEEQLKKLRDEAMQQYNYKYQSP